MNIKDVTTLAAALVLPLCLYAAPETEKALVDEGLVRRVLDKMVESYGENATVQDAFVGTDACLACHAGYKDFKKTAHHTGMKMLRDDRHSLKVMDGVINDYDRNGVDDFKQGLNFNNISSVFDRYKPNAPILGFSAVKGYTISIAGVEYPVVFTHGGTGLAKQRYVVRLPVTDRPSGWSADYYYSPIEYVDRTGAYVLFSAGNWYAANNSPRITGPVTSRVAASTGVSYYRRCSGCHATSVKTTQDSLGEWISVAPPPVYAPAGEPHYLDLDGNGWPEAYNIGCERCHGPGARHIITLTDPQRIIQPARDFTNKQRNILCGSCHIRGASSAGSFGYPYDEAAGEDYSLHLGKELDARFWRNSPTRWPDGRTSTVNRQQYNEILTSTKGSGDNPKSYCTECHDPHRPGPGGQLRETLTVAGAGGAPLKINVKVEDNTLCLACHAGSGDFAGIRKEDLVDPQRNAVLIGNVVSNHTYHPYRPEGTMGMSRCTECHMAKVGVNGYPYDVSNHTFEAIPPTKTLQYQAQGGMPNSCAVRCHRPMGPVFGLPADGSLTTWNERSDVVMAEWLRNYYGPNGAWWRTR
jgi:hypothetical protein